MRYFLVINGKKYEITGKSPVTIGSSAGNCKINEIEDQYVSRHQCTIILSPDGDWLFDGDGLQPSRNGTQVNGAILRCDSLKESDKGVQIYNKDVILIGMTRIEFLKEATKSFAEPWKETSGFNSG
ncbi:FHA domain-containing protein [Coleofasciculus sp. E2-BRE-01]|uniref:FHA domain-containing protein n=1 Tax=Coleofasciculus sp. E2-BRE-01 TaxID=3069524 RepID=UPI004062EA67